MPEIPSGYRQAIVSAIAIILSFTLVYLRFLLLDSTSGAWTLAGIVAALLLALASMAQLIALARAIDLKDDNPFRYAVTRWIFLSGTLLLIAAVFVHAIAENII